MTDITPSPGRFVVPDMPSADQLLPWLRRIDHNRWYSNYGPLNSLFEQEIVSHLSKVQKTTGLHVTTLMSGYHALKIGLQVMNLPAGSEVLLPAVTFPACPLAIQHAGLTPVLADIDPGNWQLTPEIARRAASQRKLGAVMPVAVYGVPVDAAAWDEFTQETGIPVIIDAAAAFETQIIPQNCMVAHSLHATKPFGVGEGGLLVSRKPEIIDTARQITNFGTQNRITLRDGTNAKLNEYNAAVGLAQLARRDDSKAKRRAVFELYTNALDAARLPVTRQQELVPDFVSSFMLNAPEHDAAVICDRINAAGIVAHRMYLPPLYRHPHFEGLALVDREGKAAKPAGMAQSEAMFAHVFGLPFHVFITGEDVAGVVEALRQALNKR